VIRVQELFVHRTAPLVSLLAANAVSLLGSMFTFVALPWFVLQTTGSASKAGITLAVDGIPVFIAGAFGGVLVDRVGYKPSSVLSDVATGLLIGLIPALYFTAGLSFGALLILVFLASLASQPGNTARSSLIPDLAERAGLGLTRVNSIDQAVPRMALLLGPPLAGILVVLVGASKVLWIDAVTFFVSATVVALMVPRTATGYERSEHSTLAEMFAGFRHVLRDRVLFWIVTMSAIGSLIAEPIYTIVFPVYAHQVLDSAVALGLMYSALALGSLGGLALYAVAGARIPHRVVLIGGFAVRAASFWVLVTLPSLPIVLGSIVINAICFEPMNPLITSLLQQRTPAGMRGRVFGAYHAIGVSTLPLGTLVGGFLLAGPGLVPTLLVIASASAVQALAMLAIPAFQTAPAPVEVVQ
jgi:MFS family permease